VIDSSYRNHKSNQQNTKHTKPFTMVSHSFRSISLLPFVLSTLFLPVATRALKFDLPAGKTICFAEEVMRDELCVGDYLVPRDEATGLSGISVHVTGPTPLKTGGLAKVFYSKQQAHQGKFALTGMETGSHRICFRSKATKLARISLTLKVGVAAKDFHAIAKKSHLTPVEVELNKLLDSVTEIHAEQLYSRAREEELRDTNESTADRVKWFSLVTIVVLLCLGLWQIFYLKQYFRSKKLVD
jgi:hypothetical protein